MSDIQQRILEQLQIQNTTQRERADAEEAERAREQYLAPFYRDLERAQSEARRTARTSELAQYLTAKKRLQAALEDVQAGRHLSHLASLSPDGQAEKLQEQIDATEEDLNYWQQIIKSKPGSPDAAQRIHSLNRRLSELRLELRKHKRDNLMFD